MGTCQYCASPYALILLIGLSISLHGTVGNYASAAQTSNPTLPSPAADNPGTDMEEFVVDGMLVYRSASRSMPSPKSKRTPPQRPPPKRHSPASAHKAWPPPPKVSPPSPPQPVPPLTPSPPQLPPPSSPPLEPLPPPSLPPPPSPLEFVDEDNELDELQIYCPQTLDAEGYAVDIPNCKTSPMTLAVGEDASALRASYSILSGDRANVTLVRTPESVRRRALLAGASVPEFSVKAIKKDREERSQKEIYTGTPIDLRSVVYIIDLSSCNPADSRWAPQWTRETLQNHLFYNKSAPVANALANFYTTCSYNKTYFRPENVTIVGPLKMNCSGSIPVGTPNYNPGLRANDTVLDWWDFSTYCSLSEQAAWRRQAEAFARELALTDPKLDRILRSTAPRRRNLFLLPTNTKCPWEGYADVTCTMPTCTAYVRRVDFAVGAVGPIAHEQMHNYGLMHAGTEADWNGYGDASDVMGNYAPAGKGLLCHNAPSMYRIGWATPINQVRGVGGGLYGNLTCANFTAGRNKISAIQIPAASLADDNMVIINLAATDPKATSRMSGVSVYYLSYRVRNTSLDKFDGGLPTNFSNAVIIHRYNGIQDERDLGSYPWLVTAIKTPSSWTSPFVPLDSQRRGGAIRVNVQYMSSTMAVVSLCRVLEVKETSCSNGVDDDCDGLIDDMDVSDCQ